MLEFSGSGVYLERGSAGACSKPGSCDIGRGFDPSELLMDCLQLQVRPTQGRPC